MITTERGYWRTKELIAGMEAALARRAPAPAEQHPLLAELTRAGQAGLLAEWRAEVAEYEALRDGRLARLTLAGLADLGPALRRARLAAGLTPELLAERSGLTPEQVANYEASDYRDAPLAHCGAVIAALGVTLRLEALLGVAAVATPPDPPLAARPRADAGGPAPDRPTNRRAPDMALVARRGPFFVPAAAPAAIGAVVSQRSPSHGHPSLPGRPRRDGSGESAPDHPRRRPDVGARAPGRAHGAPAPVARAAARRAGGRRPDRRPVRRRRPGRPAPPAPFIARRPARGGAGAGRLARPYVTVAVLETVGTPGRTDDLGALVAACRVQRRPDGWRAVIRLAATAAGQPLTDDNRLTALWLALDWLLDWRPDGPDAFTVPYQPAAAAPPIDLPAVPPLGEASSPPASAPPAPRARANGAAPPSADRSAQIRRPRRATPRPRPPCRPMASPGPSPDDRPAPATPEE